MPIDPHLGRVVHAAEPEHDLVLVGVPAAVEGPVVPGPARVVPGGGVVGRDVVVAGGDGHGPHGAREGQGLGVPKEKKR